MDFWLQSPESTLEIARDSDFALKCQLLLVLGPLVAFLFFFPNLCFFAYNASYAWRASCCNLEESSIWLGSNKTGPTHYFLSVTKHVKFKYVLKCYAEWDQTIVYRTIRI